MLIEANKTGSTDADETSSAPSEGNAHVQDADSSTGNQDTFKLQDLLSSSPTCTDDEAVNLVETISREELARQMGAQFRDRDTGNEFAEQLDFSVKGIRTASRLENGGYQCTAQLQLSGQGGTDTMEIVYTVELTDKGDEIYVTVYGL